jgi:hypothetical protein
MYTDERTELPENEWITSTLDGKVKKTVGAINLDFEISKYKTNALPLYIIVDSTGKTLTKIPYYTYSSDVEEFLAFLNDGISNYQP